jgi:hypothetical protein
MTSANDSAVRRALTAAGVIFIDENGGARRCDCASRCEKPISTGCGRFYAYFQCLKKCKPAIAPHH